MNARGTAGVLDAAVFLVLVTAAVATLATPAADPASPPPAEETARVLGTATASVTYTLSPGARRADPALVAFQTVDGPEFDRAAHGSLAGLLAEAATRNLSVDGRQVTRAGDDLERTVTARVENDTRRRVAVRAVWRPYRGASVRGDVRAGTPSPRDAAVDTATLTVPSEYPTAREAAVAAARRSGYAGLARVLARATVRGALPPDGVRLALRGDHPVDALVTYRYRRFGRLLGVPVGRVTPETVGATNARLAAALADRYERDLRRSFDSPAAAANATRTGEVRIVVRTWAR